ncbi:hypothetical protein JG687_00017211 [Phytophthora cactorum]|uniref:Uncharacterized protein n=1 Tax=Phytophthora cactorum TaxID=29920 RepID=A0A329RDG7_9STRA|nr:hypothetical protein Pcac1_g26806 [Phytophthora cactorum]KAG2798004.1 hypothetical protein PC112_g21541 [Phytophthora cactorum]KAG2798081.1 hypothetical protein PC111_g21005 [Phytophthora cactorum]KAG2856365.1 hypothetical protein PC113_g11634 [Phytophthora cactorum]KAG2904176.1 hypothetical protein PC114_g11944 [Phytophthora cactorum]
MTKQEIKDQRTRKHMNDLLAKTAEQFESAGDTKCVVQIKLLILPVEILADEMDLTGVGAIRGEDKARGRSNQQCAVGTESLRIFRATSCFAASATSRYPFETDAHFDNHRHVVSND